MAESVKVEMDGEARALSKDGTKFPSSSLPNASETLRILSPRYTMELIEEMDKPSRPNHHKRSISLPKYFDKFQQHDSLVAAEAKAESKSTMRATTSSTSVQIGASEIAAGILREAKGTTFEPVVNVHVHLNSNDVRAVASGTNDEALAAPEATIPSKTEVAESPVDKAGSEEQDMNAFVGDDVSRTELNELDQPLEHKQKVSEVAEILIKGSLDMDTDELALLSTKQCIMDCKDPLSPKNPDPMIKKHHREPRKSPSCATIFSKKAAQCILHCVESNDCHVFTNLFSCANEDDALVNIEPASDGNNESSVQERSRRLKNSKHKKEKKRRPSRKTEEEEETPVVFDSGGVSFCLGVGHPGSDRDNDKICHGDDREEHGSRDSSWEQDTIVMRRHDSSSIDSEAEDDENQVRRNSKEKHRHRHRHHHSEKSRSSSSHPSRRSGSRSRSNRDSSRSRSRSKSSTRRSTSRSRSRSRSCKSPSKSRRGFGVKKEKEDSSMFFSSKGKHQCPSASKSRR